MARYVSDVDLLVSHAGMVVKAGVEFEADFPKGMSLGTTLHPVKTTPPKRGKTKPVDDDTGGLV